jgi:hypothetical protein
MERHVGELLNNLPVYCSLSFACTTNQLLARLLFTGLFTIKAVETQLKTVPKAIILKQWITTLSLNDYTHT